MKKSTYVLFADNDVNFLDTRAEFLESEGYRVLKAASLAEAEWLLREVRVHIAILDIRLIDDDDEKDVSGLTLAKAPDYRTIPKIILTGFPTYQAVRQALGQALGGLPPAVDFLAKQDGPEALIHAVRRALKRYVRINWDLSIRWGWQGELSPVYLVSLILPDSVRGRLSERAGELEDLLRTLFREYDQVTLGRVLTRREGWILFSAFAYPVRGPEQQFVVECGRTLEVQTQREHYAASVPHEIRHRAVSLTGSVDAMHLGVASYHLGRCAIDEAKTLTDFYSQQPADIVLAAVDNLFQVTLKPWYAKGREKQQQPMEVFCHKWLGTNALAQAELEERVSGVCQAALVAGIKGLDYSSHRLTFSLSEGMDFSYHNPAPCLYEDRITVGPPTLCGVTHGRLDGTSVLVDRAGQTWVVDFGRAGLGPLVRDFVSLETSVKFDMLKGAGVVERHELERRLLAVHNLGEAVDTKEVEPEVEKALQVIGRIRSQAVDIVGPEMEPYLMGLLFCATERFLAYQPGLRYTKEETAIFAHALLCMGMLCQRLIAWEERLRGLPPQATISLWIDADNQVVWVEGRRVTLAPQRFRLLQYLYDYANQLCRRSDIAKYVFGVDFSDLPPAEIKLIEKDQINTTISRLRNDIEPNPGSPRYIETVRGAGYKLVLRDVLPRDRT
jgi:DNA-binding response OmpR family regulator